MASPILLSLSDERTEYVTIIARNIPLSETFCDKSEKAPPGGASMKMYDFFHRITLKIISIPGGNIS
jgi:hypothetical protein